MGIFILFVFLASAYHYTQMRCKKKEITHTSGNRQTNMSIGQELIISFSLIKNVKKMFQTHPNELNLDCVSGVKVLSMIFILASHALLFSISGPVLNTEFYDQVSRSYLVLVIKTCSINRAGLTEVFCKNK